MDYCQRFETYASEWGECGNSSLLLCLFRLLCKTYAPYRPLASAIRGQRVRTRKPLNNQRIDPIKVNATAACQDEQPEMRNQDRRGAAQSLPQ